MKDLVWTAVDEGGYEWVGMQTDWLITRSSAGWIRRD
jgi:hypothetical protein